MLIWEAIRSEFSDLPTAARATQVILRFLMAIVLGGLVGLDRERSNRTAGLRTHMLVALGAAGFVVGTQGAGFESESLSRVLQGLIAGIGFLGAGAIIKHHDKDEVVGLTTAASLWTTAAIGITVGLGKEATALMLTLAALFVLVVVRRFEKPSAE